jgi:hypothetical protein
MFENMKTRSQQFRDRARRHHQGLDQRRIGALPKPKSAQDSQATPARRRTAANF